MIQIPEMAVYWCGQARKRLWNKGLSDSDSIIEIKPSKLNEVNNSNMQAPIFKDTETCIKIGSQSDNIRRTSKKDKTNISNEQWNIMNARMDDIESRLHILDDFESKLQRLTFMIDKISKRK